MPAPLIAMGVAAGAQALSNIIGAGMQSAAADKAMKAASKAASNIATGYDSVSGAYKGNRELIDAYGNKVSSIYDVGDAKDPNSIISKYRAKMGEDLSAKGSYDPASFYSTKKLEDFYNKAWKLNNQNQLDALENSASNAGRLYSSGILNQMASTASANAENAYKDAMEAYLKDKGIDVDIWKGEEANKQAAAKQYIDQYKAQMDTMSNFIGTGLGLQGDVLSAKVSNTNDSVNTYTNYLNNYAQQLAAAGHHSPDKTMTGWANPNSTTELQNY